jgi:hypothetical protein
LTAMGLPVRDRSARNLRLIRGLIWTYFFLLMFEGFLRMILPAFSTPLLVVREPFLLLAYLVAQVSFIFPWNRFTLLFWLLGLASLALGFFVLPGSISVLFYGFRCSFLHVPLIFLIPIVMDETDVARMGRWFLILSIPIAALMAVQFSVGPDHWLNRGLDNQFRQIGAVGNKIRPPGTFTSVTGPINFYAFVAGFLIYDQFKQGYYSRKLVIAAAVATCLALAVSVSRSALASVAMVVLTAAIGIALARPQQSVKFVRFALLAVIAFFVASQLPVFDEGTGVFAQRIEGSFDSEGGASGIADRVLRIYSDALRTAEVTPWEGVGLGRGTNAGAVLYSGGLMRMMENEWSRVVFEMGAPMGFIYILIRVGIAIFVLRSSYQAARQGAVLAMLLAGGCWLNIVSGTWQQTTALGFTILGAGLCLAATRERAPVPLGARG